MTGEGGTRDAVFLALTGSGGGGVMTAGEMLLEAAAAAGWYGLMTRSMGPQIKGGEAAAFIRLATAEVGSTGDRFDLLLALDWSSVERFAGELALGPETLVIGDTDAGEVPAMVAGSQARLAALAIGEAAKAIPGGRTNMVALGILAAVAGIPEDLVRGVLEKRMGRHGAEAVEAGAAGIEAGYGAAGGLVADLGLGQPRPGAGAGRWSISGNQAAGLGALSAGVRFAAAYPITPATDLLEWLAPRIEKVGGILVQAEDELASVNMILGASFGGTPSLSATSGPGLALMQEGIGLGVATETPIVIINVMRGGPSTGIPTKTEQSDLNIAVYGTHGDAPHIVTAPTSVADCLFTTQWSVYLAEALQCPAIVLSDQLLAQSRAVIDEPPVAPHVARRLTVADGGNDYHRYALTPSGISPVALPGTPGGRHEANSTEHNTLGRPTNRAEDHHRQLDKRLGKLTSFDYGDHWADIEGQGDTAVVVWGSTTGPAREALARARRQGVEARLIAIRLLMPAQTGKFAEAMKGVRRLLVVEQSHGQQFHHYLCAHYHYCLPGEIKVFSQPGPLPMRPGQVLERLLDWD